jgi:hypothetical protein
MTTYVHQTALTQFVEANGIRFAYCRFGQPGGVPLVFNIHFMGTMDYWDPVRVGCSFAHDHADCLRLHSVGTLVAMTGPDQTRKAARRLCRVVWTDVASYHHS